MIKANIMNAKENIFFVVYTDKVSLRNPKKSTMEEMGELGQ